MVVTDNVFAKARVARPDTYRVNLTGRLVDLTGRLIAMTGRLVYVAH
jgi:hypothetical protein